MPTGDARPFNLSSHAGVEFHARVKAAGLAAGLSATADVRAGKPNADGGLALAVGTTPGLGGGLALDPAAGEVVWAVPDEATLALPVGTYWYEVLLFDADGDCVGRPLWGYWHHLPTGLVSAAPPVPPAPPTGRLPLVPLAAGTYALDVPDDGAAGAWVFLPGTGPGGAVDSVAGVPANGSGDVPAAALAEALADFLTVPGDPGVYFPARPEGQFALAGWDNKAQPDVITPGELAAVGGYALTGPVADALAAKAPLASPSLTGSPTAPTPAANASGTQVVTAAWVLARVAEALGGTSPPPPPPPPGGYAPSLDFSDARNGHYLPAVLL